MKSLFWNRKVVAIFISVAIITGSLFVFSTSKRQKLFINNQVNEGGPSEKLNPLAVEYMRNQKYPGSDIVIEQTLPPGSNYRKYIASFRSDGLKIFALLTIPQAQKPETGWPVIIFNHGYIPPAQYRTTEKYAAYTDAFSKNSYIVLKPDYRGHGNSQGNPKGAYYSPAYTIDVLNALSSIKKHKDADPAKIGLWGHSMGGNIALRAMVVDPESIKATVIWAGVVASYQDLANNWRRNRPFVLSEREQVIKRPNRQALIDSYGGFEENPEFWNSIAPIFFVKDILGPVQIHHGSNDSEVPLLFSERLDDALKKAGKTDEFYIYNGDDHNLSNNLALALNRSVEFFDRYLKKQ